MSYRILIIEDNIDKLNRVKEVLATFGDSITIDHCKSIDKASFALKNNDQYDLMILDISVPLSSNGVISKYGGVKFLNSICKRKDLNRPKEIIGLTQYKDVFEKSNPTFEKNLIYLIRYMANGYKWEEQLSNRISYLISEITPIKNHKNYVNVFFDLCKKNRILSIIIIICIIIISFGDLIEKAKSIFTIFQTESNSSTDSNIQNNKNDNETLNIENQNGVVKESIINL
jgi:CheY-like chemotaxis protein